MSSSPQRETPMSEPFTCPECGAVKMTKTVENCRLEDGLTVRQLRHFKCQSCGARFFDDARGSAMECAACLDALVAKSACTDKRIREGQELLSRIVSMLTRLVRRFAEDGRIGETDAGYEALREDSTNIEHENEHDHEHE